MITGGSYALSKLPLPIVEFKGRTAHLESGREERYRSQLLSVHAAAHYSHVNMLI